MASDSTVRATYEPSKGAALYSIRCTFKGCSKIFFAGSQDSTFCRQHKTSTIYNKALDLRKSNKSTSSGRSKPGKRLFSRIRPQPLTKLQYIEQCEQGPQPSGPGEKIGRNRISDHSQPGSLLEADPISKSPTSPREDIRLPDRKRKRASSAGNGSIGVSLANGPVLMLIPKSDIQSSEAAAESKEDCMMTGAINEPSTGNKMNFTLMGETIERWSTKTSMASSSPKDLSTREKSLFESRMSSEELEGPRSQEIGDGNTEVVLEQRNSSRSPLISQLQPANFVESSRRVNLFSEKEHNLDQYLAAFKPSSARQDVVSIADAEKMAWGHINPRIAWARDGKGRRREQRQDIATRPGRRKAQFGKILTKEMVKERRAKGWHPNQNKQSGVESEDPLEQLFGIPRNVGPKYNNGDLFMETKHTGKARKAWKVDS